jgi:hypothetical protein
MRYRLMATYRGAPYQAGIGPSSEDVTLFAACPPPEEHGFRSSSAGDWRKEISVEEIDALWESRPIGSYRGERCMVLDDLGDRLHVAYLGRDARQAKQLGYWQVDRGVFEVVVPRQEIRDLTEQRTEFPLSMLVPALARSGPGPLTDPAPGPLMDPVADSLASPGAGAEADWIGPANWDADEPGHPAASTDMAAAWHGSPAPEENGSWPGGGAGRDSGPIRGAGRNLARDTGRALPRDPARDTGRDLARDPARDRFRGAERGAERAPGRGAAAPQDARRWDSPSDSYSDAGDSAPGRRSARKARVATQWMFSELLDLAAIPHSAYAVEEEVPGAMCLLSTDGGFEVFSAADDARHEVRFFEDEEAAYFYLFGVLAAEAVRNGRLSPEPR